jgi:hypothetical protein
VGFKQQSFPSGLAIEATDPSIIAAALKMPDTVLKRPVGPPRILIDLNDGPDVVRLVANPYFFPMRYA